MLGKRSASTPARIYYNKYYCNLAVEDSKTWYPNLIELELNQKIVLEQKQDGSIYINDNKSNYSPLVTSGWGEKEWLLFSSQDEKTGIYFNVYELMCWKNNELVRNFIPCYSTTSVINVDGNSVPTNTKGLYDLVEGKFYTNQGSGDDFIAGPDV